MSPFSSFWATPMSPDYEHTNRHHQTLEIVPYPSHSTANEESPNPLFEIISVQERIVHLLLVPTTGLTALRNAHPLPGLRDQRPHERVLPRSPEPVQIRPGEGRETHHARNGVFLGP